MSHYQHLKVHGPFRRGNTDVLLYMVMYSIFLRIPFKRANPFLNLDLMGVRRLCRKAAHTVPAHFWGIALFFNLLQGSGNTEAFS